MKKWVGYLYPVARRYLSAMPSIIPTNCSGCGAAFQQQVPQNPGFVPLKIPLTSPNLLCDRCHKINYSARKVSIPDVRQFTEESLVDYFKKKRNPVFILHVCDVLDFDQSLLKEFIRQLPEQHTVSLLVNKIDVLPADASLERIRRDYLEKLKEFRIHDRIDRLFMISSVKRMNLKKLDEYILSKRAPNVDIYVVGSANAGKSEFVNALKIRTKHEKLNPTESITTSPIAGTTLDVIKIPLDSLYWSFNGAANGDLFDMPGIMKSSAKLTTFLELSDLNKLRYKKRLNVRTVPILPGESLLLGGFARIDYTEGKRNMLLSVFMPPAVQLHLTKTSKAVELSERIHKEQRNLVNPIAYQPEAHEGINHPPLQEADSFNFECEDYKKSVNDIVFSGLGWVGISGFGRCTLQVHSIVKEAVSSRLSLLPFDIKTGVSSKRYRQK